MEKLVWLHVCRALANSGNASAATANAGPEITREIEMSKSGGAAETARGSPLRFTSKRSLRPLLAFV